MKIERTHVNAIHCPFTLAQAPLWNKFGYLAPKLYSLAGFSYAHLEIVSCIKNSFSGGFSSFVMGSVRVLPLPHSALGWGSDMEVSCCSRTTHGSVWAQDLLAGLNPFQGRPEPHKYWVTLRTGCWCSWVCPSLVVTHGCCSCLLLHRHPPGSQSIVKVGLTAVNDLVTVFGLLPEFSSVLGHKLCDFMSIFFWE